MHALKDFPAIGGIYMATIFGGSLSTVSSGINSLAALTMEDILKKSLHNFQETTRTLIAKIPAFLYGILIIGLAYGASSVQGSVSQMIASISGPCGGAILGIFILGRLVLWANKYGAMRGLLEAFLLSMWLAIGNQMYGGQEATLSSPPSGKCFQDNSLREFTSDGILKPYLASMTFVQSQLGNQYVILNNRKSQQTDNFFMVSQTNGSP